MAYAPELVFVCGFIIVVLYGLWETRGKLKP